MITNCDDCYWEINLHGLGRTVTTSRGVLSSLEEFSSQLQTAQRYPTNYWIESFERKVWLKIWPCLWKNCHQWLNKLLSAVSHDGLTGGGRRRGQKLFPLPSSWQAMNAPSLGVWTWCPLTGAAVSTSGIRINDDDSGSSGRPEERRPGRSSSIHPRLSVSVRAGRMEVERRTDKFGYSERNDAKSVSGRLENTPFLTLNVTAAGRHSRGTKLPPKLQIYH